MIRIRHLCHHQSFLKIHILCRMQVEDRHQDQSHHPRSRQDHFLWNVGTVLAEIRDGKPDRRSDDSEDTKPFNKFFQFVDSPSVRRCAPSV